MKTLQPEAVTLEKIVGGGQTLGTLADGRKAFVWGGLPGETVTVRVTKKKSHFIEGIATEIQAISPERTEPADPISYVSTSPWQIMNFQAEQNYKSQLINDAFALHHVNLLGNTTIKTNNQQYHYRNKVEYSWFGDTTETGESLDLAFFSRGGKGKIPITSCSLLPDAMQTVASAIRNLLHQKGVTARQLKTLLIRCDQKGSCAWQLYVKDQTFDYLTSSDAELLPAAQGGEVIYSDPRSPASRITKRLHTFGNPILSDTIMHVPFHYATEGFFQVNLPMYEQALSDMQQFILPMPVLDLYSGVGTIGLTIGGSAPELVEINEDAVREMRRNINALHSNATAILAPSENALDYITAEKLVIVDPPRAGLHTSVTQKLLAATPPRIIYLSCNPITQARDVAMLLEKYHIVHHAGYNFFPRTPHIEHLVVLDKQ